MTQPSLTDFLIARLAEDEAVARAAMPGPWHSEESYGDAAVWSGHERCNGVVHVSWEYDGSGHSASNVEHIARHDPARVLADVEAKRKIVAEAQDPGDDLFVAILASVYADHPDYRAEEWAP